jgi:hypothetical protein
MKKNYDFSKGQKNPYYKKLKGHKLQSTQEVSFNLEDIVKLAKKTTGKKKTSSTKKKSVN